MKLTILRNLGRAMLAALADLHDDPSELVEGSTHELGDDAASLLLERRLAEPAGDDEDDGPTAAETAAAAMKATRRAGKGKKHAAPEPTATDDSAQNDLGPGDEATN